MTVELRNAVERLSRCSKRALNEAAGHCIADAHYSVEVEHLFREFIRMDDSAFAMAVGHFGLDPSTVERELNSAIEKLRTGNPRSTPEFSPHVVRLMEEGWKTASLRLGQSETTSGSLLAAGLTTVDLRGAVERGSPSLLTIPAEELVERLPDLTEASRESQSAEAEADSSSRRDESAEPETPALDRYTVDLTAEAAAGGIDPISGRETEIGLLIDILMRRRQNNPILAGEAGVGKTAIVEGFAQRVADGTVPMQLQSADVRTLDLGLLQAGAGVRGEFEKRLKEVIREVQASTRRVILFIDEAHTIIGSGAAQGQGDAANLLKPALARGELSTIAATTWGEYKQYIEKDPALARRFQVIKVEEPELEVAERMLRGVAAKLEAHHGVQVLDEAVRDAVALSDRYLSDRRLPDKAVSILDTACARVASARTSKPAALIEAASRIHSLELEIHNLEREGRVGHDQGDRIDGLKAKLKRSVREAEELEEQWFEERDLVQEILDLRRTLQDSPAMTGSDRERSLRSLEAKRRALRDTQETVSLIRSEVTSDAVKEVLSDWTGIPIGRMERDEVKSVLALRGGLSERIVGQAGAVEAICRRIETARAGLDDPAKPTAVFLLVGPSGVGKTETAVALSDLLYGGARNMITINMSEYQEAHTVSSLKGAPPGYVGFGAGGVLTEAVRRRPHSVVLLDEVEKAHPDVLEVFYQVFDKGMMEDGEGQQVDFKNCVIIMTSNSGSEAVLAAGGEPDSQPLSDDRLLEIVRPYLTERFPAAFLGRLVVVPYRPLSPDQLREIVELKLARIAQRTWEQRSVEVTWEPEVVELIVRRCTEVESGARNVEAIIDHGLLPLLSSRLLSALADGRPVEALVLRASEDEAFAVHDATSASTKRGGARGLAERLRSLKWR